MLLLALSRLFSNSFLLLPSSSASPTQVSICHTSRAQSNKLAVGAALWAADIEANSTNMTELKDARAAGESFKKDL